ncbi:MAG TPA: response regulator [Chloroflexota bacterium]|jgi:DNA-binding response OmpR family regulator
MRILVVAASTVERRALRNHVKQAGHACLVAADGLAAWDLLADGDVDVVISGRELPGLDGLALCRRLRATESGRDTYFIVLTARDDKAQAREGLEAGADDYLPLPLDPEELAMSLIAAARLVALHREQREAQLAQGRVEGVRLAARTMRHELGNKLAVTALYNELLVDEAGASPDLQTTATKALRSVREAVGIMEKLGRVTHVELTNWGADARPTLELAAATA